MKKIIFEHFHSLNELIDTMETRPLNSVFSPSKKQSSQKEEYDTNGKFTGTKSYEEAMSVIKTGYKEPLEKMKKAILKIGQTNPSQRPRTKNDFVGFVPNVPNALMNLPITMINREKQPNKSKNIHLTYSFCGSSDVRTHELIKAGINFISLVNSLEKQGYRVKIDALFASSVSKTIAAYTVNLKAYGQQLNLLKLAFPLVHPAMLRRVSFKYMETAPNLKDKDFLNGYGYPLGHLMNFNGDKERKFLKENKILDGENLYYCNMYEALKSKDVNELAKKMGLHQ
jgi:hypothetical protein